MKWGKIILAAIVITIFQALYGMLTCGWLFKWVYTIEPISVWKAPEVMTGSFWGIVHGGNLIASIILAIVYAVIRNSLPQKCACCAGSTFGLIVWAVGCLPGMFAMYMFSTIAPTVLIYWAISGLVSLIIMGIIIAGIYEKKPSTGCCCCH